MNVEVVMKWFFGVWMYWFDDALVVLVCYLAIWWSGHVTWTIRSRALSSLYMVFMHHGRSYLMTSI